MKVNDVFLPLEVSKGEKFYASLTIGFGKTFKETCYVKKVLERIIESERRDTRYSDVTDVTIW